MTRPQRQQQSPAAMPDLPASTNRRGRAAVMLGLALLATVRAANGAEPTAAATGDRAGAQPTGFFYGGVLGLSETIYRDYDEDPMLLPIIGYRGENLQVLGPFVTYTLYRRDALSFDARLSPRFAGYDDSDGDIFRGMDERKETIDVGLGMTWEQNRWKFELAGLYDALDRSNGYEWSASLGKSFRAGRFSIEPAVGIAYQDRRLVDYYYGVENDEAATFRPAYRGDSAVNTTLGIDFSTMAFFGGMTRIGIENTWYDSEISDSPLTDEDSGLALMITFSKFFDS